MHAAPDQRCILCLFTLWEFLLVEFFSSSVLLLLLLVVVVLWSCVSGREVLKV